jgi:hypothetical protein
VALRIAARESFGKSYLTVWPAGEPRPDVTNLSTEPGLVRSVVAISGVGADGEVSVYNDKGRVHLTRPSR